MTSGIKSPCIGPMRDALCGYGFALRPSAWGTDILVESVGAGQRFVLRFSPGSEAVVLDTDAAQELALVWLSQAPKGYGHVYLLGRDEGFLFRQQVRWLHLCDARNMNVAKAIDILTPSEVRDARARGLKVVRQGDIWFIPLVQEAGSAPLYETRHEAEKVTQLPGGGVLASGWVRHPQHRAVYLDAPHLVCRSEVGD